MYRAYVWGRGLRDFGLADAWTNVWIVPTSTFWWTGFFGSEEERSLPLIAASALAYVLYEFMQMTDFIGLVFDWKDVLGTLLGVPVALAAHRFVERRFSAPAR